MRNRKKNSYVVCPSCNCAVNKKDKTCPMCGTSLSNAAPLEKEESLSSTVLKDSNFKRIKIATIAGVAVLVLAIAVPIIFSIVSSNDLAQRAESASQDAANNLVSQSVYMQTTQITESVLGVGGLVGEWNDEVLISSGAKILSLPAASFDGQDNGEAVEKTVAVGNYAYLIVVNNTLYAVGDITSGAAEQPTGKTVVAIDLEDTKRTPQTVFTAQGVDVIVGMGKIKDTVFILLSSGTASSLVTFETGQEFGDNEIETTVVHEFDVPAKALFIESAVLYVVTEPTDASWTIEQSKNLGQSWFQFMKGSVDLAATTLLEDSFYYSAVEDKKSSSLRAQKVGGSFKEYGVAKNVLSIVANNDVMVTLSDAKNVGWLSPSTGVWHDLQSALSEAISSASKIEVSQVSVYKNWAVVILANNAVVLLDVNGSVAPLTVL